MLYSVSAHQRVLGRMLARVSTEQDIVFLDFLHKQNA
jgi:hypothetical protein